MIVWGGGGGVQKHLPVDVFTKNNITNISIKLLYLPHNTQLNELEILKTCTVIMFTSTKITFPLHIFAVLTPNCNKNSGHDRHLRNTVLTT